MRAGVQRVHRRHGQIVHHHVGYLTRQIGRSEQRGGVELTSRDGTPHPSAMTHRHPHPGRARRRARAPTSCASSSGSSTTTRAPTRSRSRPSTPSSSSSATPRRPRTSTSPPSAWSWSPTPGRSTGNRDHKAYVLRSGSARFVVKGGVAPDSPLLDHHRRHGDGVVDLALEVPDVDKCIAHARSAGRDRARGAARPDRRARHRAHRRDRGVRRDAAHPGRPLRATPGRTCPGYVARTVVLRASVPARPSASSRRSTTASATSSSGAWTSGSRSTTRSWAS